MHPPGRKAREPAPTSRGRRMVFTRERSRGPGDRATAEPPVSSSQHSMKGMVKMPARLVPTVSSSASAALPPTACAKAGRCQTGPARPHARLPQQPEERAAGGKKLQGCPWRTASTACRAR